MPLQDLQNTLQVFLSTGEDIEDSFTSTPFTGYGLMAHILKEPPDQNPFFAFVLSTIGSDAFGDNWWANLLCEAAVDFGTHDYNKALAILPFCNQKITLKALMMALYRIRTLPNKNQLENLRILFERAEGLTLFFCGPSLIHLASQSSYEFARLQHIFKSLQIGKKDLTPPDVEIQDQSWTGQKLGVLFTYPAIPISECKPSWESFTCEKCNYMFDSSQSIRVRNDVPWQQKVQRIKDGLDPDGPLTEKERQKQEEWNGYVVAENEGVCSLCYRDSLEEKHQQEAYGLGLNYFTC